MTSSILRWPSDFERLYCAANRRRPLVFCQHSGIGATSNLLHLLICSAKTVIRSAVAFCHP
jgi:hypothetical protein